MIADNGRWYSLTDARLVARYDSGHYPGDPWEVEEELYLHRSGQWLLMGYGGAYTIYALPAVGGGKVGWSALRAITIEEARQWVVDRQIDEDDIPEDLLHILCPSADTESAAS